MSLSASAVSVSVYEDRRGWNPPPLLLVSAPLREGGYSSWRSSQCYLIRVFQSRFVAGASVASGEAEDANFRLSPKQPPESSDQVPPLRTPVEPLSFRPSPLSPESPKPQRSFLAATSGSGFEAPAALVFAGGHTPPRVPGGGSQRRRGLLAACSTPRSSTPRKATDDLSVHYGGTAQAQVGRASAASSLLHNLAAPASDTLSGGVDGMYRWPVTHAHRPEPVGYLPPRAHAPHTSSWQHRICSLRKPLAEPMLRFVTVR